MYTIASEGDPSRVSQSPRWTQTYKGIRSCLCAERSQSAFIVAKYLRDHNSERSEGRRRCLKVDSEAGMLIGKTPL